MLAVANSRTPRMIGQPDLENHPQARQWIGPCLLKSSGGKCPHQLTKGRSHHKLIGGGIHGSSRHVADQAGTSRRSGLGVVILQIPPTPEHVGRERRVSVDRRMRSRETASNSRDLSLPSRTGPAC